ncbi:MAG: PucR family transcriptional regulator [Actinomycetota bacterium]
MTKAADRSDNGHAEVSLGTLLANLGPTVARVLVAPRGLDVPVGEAFIHDRLEDPPLEPDAIVLAIGTEPDSAEARRVIAHAVEAKAAAVAFKLYERRCEWIADAEKGGVAILEIANEMGWSQLNALLTLSLPSLRQSAPVPGLASVPMGDLFSLANAIAGVVGGAVTIEDPQARVLAYSNIEGQEIDEARQQSILGRQVPDTPGMRDLYKQLWASDSVIHVKELEGFDILSRIAAPIRVGAETIGSVWAIEPEGFDESAERAFAEAARVAALHLIHARASRDIERRIRGNLLRSFLEGKGDIDSAAAQLGIGPRSPSVVIALKLASNDPVEEELYRERLIDLVAMYSDAFRLRISWVTIGNTAYGLMPVAGAGERSRVMNIVQRVHDHARSTLDVPVVAAVSSTVKDIREIAAARREAERILRVLSSDGHGQDVASIDDVQTPVTLLILQDAVARNPDLVRGPVEEIAKHDRDKGSVYLDTLREYLAAFGDVPTAAARLDVHPNTFRYRLRRLVEMFAVDLDDPDTRLLLHLQLRLMGPHEG